MPSSLNIPNPFTFKTSLDIALEVTFPVLPADTHENLKDLVNKVPNHLWPETIAASQQEKSDLKECIQAFKQTKTCSWMREDFLEALNDIERQC